MTTDQSIYLAIVQGLMAHPNRNLRPEEIVKTADSYFAEIQPRVAALATP